MIKIVTHQPPVTPTSKPVNQSHSVAPIEKVNKERQNIPQDRPFVERRKKNDRRNRRAARGPYDMRRGGDRRKNTHSGGSIEVDA